MEQQVQQASAGGQRRPFDTILRPMILLKLFLFGHAHDAQHGGDRTWTNGQDGTPASNTCASGQARLENRSENPTMDCVSPDGKTAMMNLSWWSWSINDSASRAYVPSIQIRNWIKSSLATGLPVFCCETVGELRTVVTQQFDDLDRWGLVRPSVGSRCCFGRSCHRSYSEIPRAWCGPWPRASDARFRLASTASI